MNSKVEPQHIEVMEDLYKQGKSYKEIAFELFERYNIMFHSDTVRYFVKRKKKKKKSYVEKLAEQKIEKALVMSDFHIPYNRDDILDIIKQHSHEITTLILGGDLIDCKPVSKFSELGKGSLSDEMAIMHKTLKQIADITPGIKKILIYGNHESRLNAYMARNANELNNLHTNNILLEVTGGFKTVNHSDGTITYFDKLDDFTVIDNWYCKHNDMIVAHPTTFSRVAGKTGQQAIEYFVDAEIKFQACLIAHTHKIASCNKNGKYAFEFGCLCKPQKYAMSGKLTYTRQSNGYFMAVFNNKKFDPNLSRQIYIRG